MNKLFTFAFLFLLSASAFAQPCSDLFISEYVEGGSSNKAIEIYNPTASAIDLTGYKLQLFTNGSATAQTTLNLAGIIAAGDVYVVVNSLANAAIKATRDTSSGVTNFNGNDAIALFNGTTIIDLIGEIGNDPGASWAIDSGSTANQTLVRKSSVQEGTPAWTTGVTQWDLLPQDSIQLGAHTMTSCAAPTDTIARFSPVAASVSETAGTYNINLTLNQAATSDKTVDLDLLSGDASDIGIFTTTTINILANTTTASFSLTITDDSTAEGDEQFSFILTNPSAGLLLDEDSIFILTILDDDSILPLAPLYSIATVTTVDTAGVADSSGVQCRVSGVVYGINLRGTGLQFTIHDGTGGMGIFSSTNTFGYTVEEGDSIVVSGEVGQFNGYAQMESLDTLYEVGSGILLSPINTTVLDESTESELVRINNLTLVNPSQWDNSNPNGFTVDVTNGSQTFELRIEEQVDIFNQNAPTSSFDVIGLGSQFDNSSPFDEGYQILPRYTADLILHTGIKERNNLTTLTIYPNPGFGTFNILHENQKGNAEKIRITDMTGKVVFEKFLEFGAETLINLEGIAPGLYIASVFSEKSAFIGKLQVLSVK